MCWKAREHRRETVTGKSQCMGAEDDGGVLKHLQFILHVFPDFHDGCLVTAAVAVVWSTEDSDNVFTMDPVVTLPHGSTWDVAAAWGASKATNTHLHDQLMSSCNEVQAISIIELL